MPIARYIYMPSLEHTIKYGFPALAETSHIIPTMQTCSLLAPQMRSSGQARAVASLPKMTQMQDV